ncbi:pirin-like C-terminal cupin domain-containing protein [Streptomyces avermitilis]
MSSADHLYVKSAATAWLQGRDELADFYFDRPDGAAIGSVVDIRFKARGLRVHLDPFPGLRSRPSCWRPPTAASTAWSWSTAVSGQHVAMGPFVMNSASEIEQAFRDFHSGGFGDIPNQARLQFR